MPKILMANALFLEITLGQMGRLDKNNEVTAYMQICW